MTARGLFVTGTDTGVGKTRVAVALIHALRARGLRVAAMKPVSAGSEAGGALNEEVTALLQAANVAAISGGTLLANNTSGSATGSSPAAVFLNSGAIFRGTGAGGTITQATSKSTGVTLDKICGQITLNNASLGAATSVSFTLTNSQIGANDVVVASIASAATAGAYTLTVDAVASGSCRFHLRNETAGGLGEALVINYVVIKAVTS